jgi:hypothetical protein
MSDKREWEKPKIIELDISLTRDVCPDGKVLPGNDAFVDSTNNDAPCGS